MTSPNTATDPPLHRAEHDGLLVFATGMMLLACMVGFTPILSDPDLWFHLADGQHILTHHEVPDTDPFSFTKAGELWVPHSWLFDVIVTLTWHHLGPRTTEAMMAMVFMVTIAFSYSILVNRGLSPVTALGICVGLAIAAGNTRGVRPQVFSLLFCNLLIYILVVHRERPRRSLIAIVPLLFLIWAQFHSACVLGLVVLAIWMAGRGADAFLARSWHMIQREFNILAVTLLLSALAILITPHAMTHYGYVAMTMGLDELKRTAEWQAPAALALEVPDLYMYLVLAAVIVILARRRRVIPCAELLLCIALVILGLSGVRHIPLACVGSVPLIAQGLAPNDRFRRPRPSLNWKMYPVACVTLGLPLILLWRYPTDIATRYRATEPVRGAAALKELDRPLRVFTTYNTGSYILFSDPGRLQVFVDSRADVYGDEILGKAYHASFGRNWQSLFDEWRIEAAVVQRHDPLARQLLADSTWIQLDEDPSALTFLRADVLRVNTLMAKN